MRVVIWIVGLVVALLSMQVRAIDTTTCGAMKCEISHAADGRCSMGGLYQCVGSCTKAALDFTCPNGQTYHANASATTWRYGLCQPGTVGTAGAALDCQCSAQPDSPGGPSFAKSGGKRCKAGCLEKPTGPQICWESDPIGHPGQKTCDQDGWTTDGGANCNPIAPPSDPPNPPPDPGPCKTTAAGDNLCVTTRGHPPEFCGYINGVYVCVPDNQGPCVGSQNVGHVCVGNPPPDPPPPPATPPDPNNPDEPAPPEISAPGDNCINSVCAPITINIYPPGGSGGGGGGDDGGDGGDGGDDGDDGGQGGHLCPGGSEPDEDGNCDAEHGQCPDGSDPVNGQCAGQHLCANGEPPVGGVCGGNGNCANGFPPANGQCPTTCADGSTPVNGMCEAPWENCQNGQPPVNGHCAATECNPETDPNQCGNGHADGGGTCGAPPACNGDQIACAVLFQTWSTRCEVSKLNPEQLPQASDYGTDFQASQAWAPQTGEEVTIDDTGWLGGGECPQLPAVSFMGASLDPGAWIPCDALHILSTIILLAGYAQAAYIIGRT